MSGKLIVFVYAVILLSTYVSVWGLYNVAKGNRLIKFENATPSKQDIVKRNEKKFNTVAKVAVIIYAVLNFVLFIIPAALDIPIIIKKEYAITKGQTLNKSEVTSKAFPSGITVKDNKSQQIVRIRCYFTDVIDQGAEVKIVYLPNLKIGSVTERP